MILSDDLYPKKNAFTFIEILIVVILLGVVAGLSIPNLGPTYENFQLSETTKNLTYLMRYAQSRAILKGEEFQLEFDTDKTSYWLTHFVDSGDGPVKERVSGRFGRRFAVPDGVHIVSGREDVRFYPDGRMDKVRIYLDNGRRDFTVSTQEQLGHVHVFDFRL